MNMRLDQPRPFGEAEQAPAPEDDAIEPTEDEQALYNLVVSRAYKIIHGTGREETLKMLGSGEDPGKATGQVASMLLSSLAQSAKSKGQAIPNEVLMNAGMEITEDLLELGETAGIFQFDDEASAKEQVENAMMYMTKGYGENALQSGLLSDQDQEQARSIVEQEMAAEQQQIQRLPVRRGVEQALAPQPKPQGIIAAAGRA